MIAITAIQHKKKSRAQTLTSVMCFGESTWDIREHAQSYGLAGLWGLSLVRDLLL